MLADDSHFFTGISFGTFVCLAQKWRLGAVWLSHLFDEIWHLKSGIYAESYIKVFIINILVCCISSFKPR